MKKTYILLSFFILIAFVSRAQNKSNQGLESLKNKLYADFLKDQKEVKTYVEKTGQPAKWSTKDKTFEIQKIDKTGKPIVLATESNVEAANTTGASAGWTGGSLGLNLNGQGMIIGEWDGGAVLGTHQEFTPSRVIQVDGATTVNFHATHVAGTLIGNGTNANAKGMMHQGTLWAHDWTNDQGEMATAALNGLRISNHSYGWLTGWAQNGGSWFWYGNTSASQTSDNQFGMYNNTAQQWDQVAFNAPNYLIVKSAGNDRGEGPTAGATHFVWSGSAWVSSTSTRDRDGGTSGYDCMSYSSVSKNILTVGAVNRIASGYSSPSSVVMSSFSAWGPTDDGRIKPDIVGAGVGLFSAYTPNNNSYASLSGTSMSGPNVAGSLGLVQQHAQNVRGSMLRGATLKGLAIHTANEAGASTGPDYVYGWGLLNVVGAVSAINAVPASSGIFENTLAQGATYQIDVFNDGTKPLEATISWYDPAGPTNASNSFNDRTARLVNDLDLRIIRNSDSNANLPWVLNPDAPTAAATKGDNIKDNVEKVSILNPSAGWYTVRVTHKGSLTNGTQAYSLVYTGASLSQQCTEPTVGGTASGPASLVQGAAGSFSLAGFNGTDFQWQSSTNGGASWLDIVGAVTPNSSFSLLSGSYLIRASVTRINCTIAFSNNLSLSVILPVGNTFADPIIVSTPYSTNISNGTGSGYTNTYTGLNNQASADIFFRFTTGSCTDNVTVSTCGSSFDTYLHLLAANGAHLVSNDDNGPSCTGTRASISYAVQPNTVYYAVVEGFNTDVGNISLFINEQDNNVFTPTISAGGPTSFCQGGSVVLTASSGSSYSWSTGATTQAITVGNSGNYSASVTNANGCQGTSAVTAVQVNANPTLFSLSGNGSYCSVSSGASVTLSGSQIGINYSFQFTGGGVAGVVSGTGAVLEVNNVTGSGTLIVVATNATTGCIANMTGFVAIMSLPATTWYRDQDGDGFGSAGNSIQACGQPGGYVANASDCDDVYATVNPGAIEVCGNGVDDNCNGQIDENCTVYTWYRDQDVDGFGNPAETTTTSTPVAPTGYLAVAGDCDDNNADVNPNATEICNGVDDNCDGIVDNGVPAIAGPSVIAGPIGVCRNSIGNVFSIEPVEGATGYIWTLPNGATGSSNTNSISVNFSTTYVTSNICVRATNSCVQSDNFCRSVVYFSARPGTAAVISGQKPVCTGSTHTYTTLPIANATSYNWTAPANSTITSGQGTNTITLAFATNFATATLTLRAVNCVGFSTTARTLSITKQGAPATPSVITGTTPVCPGSTRTYSVLQVAGVTSYNWTLPANASIQTGQGSNNVTVSFASNYVTANISVTATGCGGTSAARALRVVKTSIPATPGLITGTTPVCPGNTFTYSIVPVANTDTYNWTAPANATIASGQGTNSVQVAINAGFVSGNLTVSGSNCSGNGAIRSYAIGTVTAVPTSISGPVSAVCAGSTQSYTSPSVTGAAGYLWTVPSGASVVSGQGTNAVQVTFPTNFASGSISVRSTTACFASANRSITVAALPALPGKIVGPAIGVCGGSTRTYSVTGLSGLTYNWEVPAGALIQNGQGTNGVEVLFPLGYVSGIVRVQAQNGCGLSSFRALTVNALPATPGIISGAAVNACGGTYTYLVSAVASAISYNWTLPAGWILQTNNGTSITVSIPANFVSGNLTISASNTCGTGGTRAFAVVGRPATPGVISGQTSICSNANNVAYSTAGIAGLTYNWTMPASASIASGAGASSILVNFGPTAGIISVTASNSCGISAVRALSVGLAACRNIAEDLILSATPSVFVYPNPGKGLYTLKVNGFESTVSIRIYNMLGQLVKEQAIEPTTMENKLDLTAMPSGAYMLKFESESFNKSIKLLKE